MTEKSDLDRFLADMEKLFGPSLENFFGFFGGIICFPWRVWLWLREKPSEAPDDKRTGKENPKSKNPFKDTQGEWKEWFVWTFWGFVIVALFIILAYVLFCFAKDKAGSFGDSFGFATSFFSSLALIGVIVAIYLQRKDIALQIREMNDQTKVSLATSFLDAVATYDRTKDTKHPSLSPAHKIASEAIGEIALTLRDEMPELYRSYIQNMERPHLLDAARSIQGVSLAPSDTIGEWKSLLSSRLNEMFDDIHTTKKFWTPAHQPYTSEIDRIQNTLTSELGKGPKSTMQFEEMKRLVIRYERLLWQFADVLSDPKTERKPYLPV